MAGRRGGVRHGQARRKRNGDALARKQLRGTEHHSPADEFVAASCMAYAILERLLRYKTGDAVSVLAPVLSFVQALADDTVWFGLSLSIWLSIFQPLNFRCTSRRRKLHGNICRRAVHVRGASSWLMIDRHRGYLNPLISPGFFS